MSAVAWVHHNDQWGDLTVNVIPYTRHNGEVVDSNTGVVLDAPFHKDLIGKVVVRDARTPLCDHAYLHFLLTGEKKNCGRICTAVKVVTHVPTKRLIDSNRSSDGFRAAVEALTKQHGRQRAEAIAERVLGYGSYAANCSRCPVEVLNDDPAALADQLQAYGWTYNKTSKMWLCPAHEDRP